MRNYQKTSFLLISFILLLLVTTFALSRDPLKIAIVTKRGGLTAKPYQNKLVVKKWPVLFLIELENISNSSQEIHKVANADRLYGVQFEITEENGRKTIMKQKRRDIGSHAVISKYLGPGKSLVTKMLIDPDKWDNVVEFKPGKDYKLRVIYESSMTKIYSDYYTLTRSKK